MMLWRRAHNYTHILNFIRLHNYLTNYFCLELMLASRGPASKWSHLGSNSTTLWPLPQHGGSGQDWPISGDRTSWDSQATTGDCDGPQTRTSGDWQQAADSTLGRTTDGSTDGVATEGVACRGGLSEEPHILGNGARGQARTGVKCVGRPTLSWKDHQQKMEG